MSARFKCRFHNLAIINDIEPKDINTLYGQIQTVYDECVRELGIRNVIMELVDFNARIKQCRKRAHFGSRRTRRNE